MVTPKVNRISQIIRFLTVSRLLLWTMLVIYRERQRVVRARQRGNYDIQPNIEVLIEVAENFRKTAINLGVLMIKLGQFLSSRADLLPEQALKVLSTLQDEVPPAPFEHVVQVIESELDKPIDQVFRTLERKCTASASLGQVHKAVLAATGKTVAVKVLRPNIDQLVRMDLSSLRFVIRIITFFIKTGNFIDLMGIYRELQSRTYEEIDYVNEAAHARRFREMFANDPTIYIPRVYDEYVTRRVLVLEWVDGIKINDYAALEAARVSRLEVATLIVNAYFHQFFEAGFFHADPHPGNIFVKSCSLCQDPVIAFVDFGMIGTLSRNMKNSLKDVFLGFVMHNAHQIVEGLVKLGFIGQGANLSSIERSLSIILEQYYDINLGEIRELDFSTVVQELEELLYGQPFRVPAQFAYTGRAIGILVGVATGLAPNFNFVDVVTPYAYTFLGLDAQGIRGTVQEVLSQLLESGRVLLALPNRVEQLIDKINTGQLEVRVGSILAARHERALERRRESGGLSYFSKAIIFVAALGAGLYLSTTHDWIPAWFCLGLAGLTALVLWIKG